MKPAKSFVRSERSKMPEPMIETPSEVREPQVRKLVKVRKLICPRVKALK